MSAIYKIIEDLRKEIDQLSEQHSEACKRWREGTAKSEDYALIRKVENLCREIEVRQSDLYAAARAGSLRY